MLDVAATSLTDHVAEGTKDKIIRLTFIHRRKGTAHIIYSTILNLSAHPYMLYDEIVFLAARLGVQFSYKVRIQHLCLSECRIYVETREVNAG